MAVWMLKLVSNTKNLHGNVGVSPWTLHSDKFNENGRRLVELVVQIGRHIFWSRTQAKAVGYKIIPWLFICQIDVTFWSLRKVCNISPVVNSYTTWWTAFSVILKPQKMLATSEDSNLKNVKYIWCYLYLQRLAKPASGLVHGLVITPI